MNAIASADTDGRPAAIVTGASSGFGARIALAWFAPATPSSLVCVIQEGAIEAGLRRCRPKPATAPGSCACSTLM